MNRAVAAVLLEAAFFALAFGWRSWIHWRRTGSTGFVRPRRVIVEEPYLRAIHGPAYDAYRATVGRFLPCVGLASPP